MITGHGVRLFHKTNVTLHSSQDKAGGKFSFIQTTNIFSNKYSPSGIDEIIIIKSKKVHRNKRIKCIEIMQLQ